MSENRWFANRGQMLQIGIATLALLSNGRIALREILASQYFSWGALFFYALIGLVTVSFVLMIRSNRRLFQSDETAQTLAAPEPRLLPSAPLVPPFVSPTKWPVLTLQRVWHEPAKGARLGYYGDTIHFTITVAGGSDLEIWSPVWAPIWKSANLVTEAPPGGLRREGPKGWRADDWEPNECSCLKLSAGRTFTGWIGVSSPEGQSLAVRIPRGKTGDLVFPLKLEGKLRYERVTI
jgi:hypothetical protein